MAIDTERHARTVNGLTDSGYDAVICSSATEVLLLTGYWPVMSASVAVFQRSGQVNVIVPEDECELAAKTSSAGVIPYKPEGLHTLENPLQLMEEQLRDAVKGLSKARVGMQLGHGVQPSGYAVSNQFRASLLGLLKELQPDASYESCDDLLENMKAAKTRRELDTMRIGCRIAGEGFAKAATCIRPGLREVEVAAAAQAAFETAEAAKSFQRSYGYFFCMSGPNAGTAGAAYARTRQRRIAEGDTVMVHANTCADGYWTDLTRTYIAGTPTGRQSDIRSAIDEALRAGFNSIRSGTTGSEIDRRTRGVMKAHGFGEEFTHAAGHGVGFAAANPSGRPRIHPLSPDVLAEGMTFNLEPAAYFGEEGGMRHCDVVEVTQEGGAWMSQF